MALFLLSMLHFTENSLFCVLISPATKKEETISFVNIRVDKVSMTRFNDSFNFLPRSITKYAVICKKKKVHNFKAANLYKSVY